MKHRARSSVSNHDSSRALRPQAGELVNLSKLPFPDLLSGLMGAYPAYHTHKTEFPNKVRYLNANEIFSPL